MEYFKFIEDKFYLDIPKKSGIYIIYSILEDGKPQFIPRVLKVDSKGILYIGKSKNINERLRMLFRVLNPEKYKTSGHTFGKNYNSSCRLKEAFPVDKLVFKYTLAKNYSELEKIELKNYFNEFGEVPPLNFSM
jgi:hypothetical protein